MKVVLRDDKSGVSEVVGTILILAITVVLFSTIIIWVSNIPAPTAQTRLDLQATLTPVYAANGTESGVNITLLHNGGESLSPAGTVIYIQDQKGNAAPKTDILHLSLWHNAAAPNGLLDGNDKTWNIGERWAYSNNTMRSADKITVTIVDTVKGVVLFNSQLTPPPGTRPPVFVNIWATQTPALQTIVPLQSGRPIYILAQIMSPDNDLDKNKVFASLTMFYGTGDSCALPQQMNDNGASGDQVANDGVFTLWRTCINSADIGWDGALVLLNATDLKGHTTTTRFTLHITPGTGGGGNGGGGAGSGRPPNLRWNGNQGYNLFNASQWDQLGYAAKETRTFREGDTVVMVIGSLVLENTFGVNKFNLWDPYSGNPAQSVVYGASKTVGQGSVPSSTQAFSFFQFVNGYYIYTYRFTLNTASQTNFYVTPPSHPPYYYFASYPLSVLLTSSTGNRFSTTDSVNITSNAGVQRSFPKLQTFSDSGYNTKTTVFNSTAIMYVQVQMLTVDLNSSMAGKVIFGNMMIQDFAGGLQLNRAPTSGIYSNLPICPPGGSCSSSSQAIWSVSLPNVYRFAINLARVNQDPWVAGAQNYALILSSIKDSDETYTQSSLSVTIRAPLYKMDMLTGNAPASNNAFGSKDYMYFEQDYNGFDAWKPLRIDYCSGGSTISGIPGNGAGKCAQSTSVGVAFGDFWHDGTLGAAESIIAGTNAVVIYRHTIDATGAVAYLPVFFDYPTSPTCTAIAAGDVTGNGLPSVVCGGSDGKVWYYANNGNWTQVVVDTPASGQSINSVAIGDFNGDGWNDIAVAGAGGYMKYYPNLGYGRFQNSGISDNWFPVSEQIVNGTIASGSYLNTFLKDGSYEQLQEGALNMPLLTGATVNAAMNSSAANWTFATAYNTATGSAQAAGGNPGAFAQVTTTFKANSVVAGYWYQSFVVSGSQPFSASLSLNYEVTAGTSGTGSETMYAFVDSTCAAPPQNPTAANYVWSSGTISGTRAWTAVSGINVGGKITTAPGSGPTTYCLKVAMYSTYGGSGGNAVGGFDNVGLTWSSTPGTTSALQEYWRIGPLPTRPGTTFTFNLYGHEAGGTTGPDFDNFTLAYSTNVIGTDPTTGTYTTMFTITSSADANYAFGLPVAVAGTTIWIRAVDTNRVVGATNLDNLYVDQLYINANTPSGTTGATLTNPGDASAINTINSQDQNADGYWDLVAGTAAGKVFKYMGSAGGLITPGGALYSNGGTSIVGVRFGNFSTNFAGLEVAVAYGTTVSIIRGDTGGVILAALPAFSPSSTITAFAVGDVNGDGWDDVAIGTSGGVVFLWENLGQGTSWTYAVTVASLGAQVFSLALGDSLNSQYQGR